MYCILYQKRRNKRNLNALPNARIVDIIKKSIEIFVMTNFRYFTIYKVQNEIQLYVLTLILKVVLKNTN